MIGTTWRREQGLKDALLREVLKENGYENVPLYGNETPEIAETKRRTYAFGNSRTGPVNPNRTVLATVGSWEKVYETKNIGIVRATVTSNY